MSGVADLGFPVAYAGEDHDVLEWYLAAGVHSTFAALHMGRGDRVRHAATIDALIRHRDPNASPIAPAGLESLARVFDALREHEADIRQLSARRNPFEVAPMLRQPAPMPVESLLARVTDGAAAMKQRSLNRAVEAARTGKAATRLRDLEELDKQPYVNEMVGVLCRAVVSLQRLDPPQLPRLLEQVLAIADNQEEEDAMIYRRMSKGPINTLRNHTLTWIRFELWFEGWTTRRADDSSIPITERVYVKYLEHLDKKQCGPAVPEATRAGMSWMARKIGFDAELISDFAQDIIDRVQTVRGKPLREADAPPLATIRAAERALRNPATPFWCRVALGWLLMMIWASCRADDMLQILPRSVKKFKSFVAAMCRKTKNQPRGCKLAIPNVYADTEEWLPIAVDLYLETFVRLYPIKAQREAELDRDYFLDRIYRDATGAWCCDQGVPMKAQHSTDLYRQLMIFLGLVEPMLSKCTKQGAKSVIPTLSAHDGRSSTETRIACRWASEEMPMKYARRTGAIGIRMVSELARDLRDGWNPLEGEAIGTTLGKRHRADGPVSDRLTLTALPADLQLEVADPSDLQDDPEDDPSMLPLFYLATGHEWKNQLGSDKWMDGRQGHLLSIDEPTQRLACRRQINGPSNRYRRGRSIGDVKMVTMVCGTCQKRRPDAVASFAQAAVATPESDPAPEPEAIIIAADAAVPAVAPGPMLLSQILGPSADAAVPPPFCSACGEMNCAGCEPLADDPPPAQPGSGPPPPMSETEQLTISLPLGGALVETSNGWHLVESAAAADAAVEAEHDAEMLRAADSLLAGAHAHLTDLGQDLLNMGGAGLQG